MPLTEIDMPCPANDWPEPGQLVEVRRRQSVVTDVGTSGLRDLLEFTSRGLVDVTFITSANLSDAAMERNMEAGILVRGGHLPLQLDNHVQTLVDSRVIRPQ